MGYSCPVCETPQHDSEHLANHLAMTAMLHEDDHEAWLDEHVDGWEELTPPALGTQVVEAAEEVDYDEAAMDAADIPEERRGESADHDHGHQSAAEQATPSGEEPTVQSVTDDLDLETEQILEEAMELTKQRREAAADDDEE